MVDGKVAVRRIRVDDGDTQEDIALGLPENAIIRRVQFVPIAIHQDGVTYDIYFTYVVSGAEALEYSIFSNITNEADSADALVDHDIGTTSIELTSDIHKRDATNGRVITNIILVNLI